MPKKDSGSSSELTLEDRFWAKVDIKGPDECWEWKRATNDGYGVIRESGHGRQLYTHRLSWKLHNGSIPEGMCVLHHCDNRACVNPAHLFLGTLADNDADRDRKGRQAKGETNGRAKLIEQDVLDIWKSPLKHYILAAIYGVNRPNISRIKRGETWGWLTEGVEED